MPACLLPLHRLSDDTATDHRLALVDLRGAVSLRGWWVGPLVVLVGAWAAAPTWNRAALVSTLAAAAAALLLGAFWTDVATAQDTPPLRLIWPPLLAVALSAGTTPPATLLALAWSGLALLHVHGGVAALTWPRALGAVAFPWWLGWFAVGGGVHVEMVMAPLAAAWLARDCWRADTVGLWGGAALLAALLMWRQAGVRLAALAVLLVGIWVFRVQRSRRGDAWYRQHVQPWVVVLLGVAAGV